MEVGQRSVKKVPLLRGKTAVLLFFEASTRTRTTFEIAAKRLSADVVTLDVAASSASKGESLLDTVATLRAMHCELFVVRHADSGAGHLIAGIWAPMKRGVRRRWLPQPPHPGAAGPVHAARAPPRPRRLKVSIVAHLHCGGRAAGGGLRWMGVTDIAWSARRRWYGGVQRLGGRVCHTLKAGSKASTWCWAALAARAHGRRLSPLDCEFYACYAVTR